MKVKELIEQLKTLNQDADVVTYPTDYHGATECWCVPSVNVYDPDSEHKNGVVEISS